MRFGNGLARAGRTGGDLTEAAAQAAQTARAGLAGRIPDLGFVFVCARSTDEAEAAGARACAVLGARSVIGCGAPGVIGQGSGIEGEPAVAVWAAALPEARLRTFHLDVVRATDSITVLGMPDPADDAVGVLLADPWSFPVDGFVELSNDVLPGLPFVGGLATGPTGGGVSWLRQDEVTHDGGAVGVLIGGPVEVATVVSQGCRPVGPTMVVTRAEGNELLELAGTPAADKLREILGELEPGDRDLAASGLHIGIAMDEYAESHDRGDFLVRGVAGLESERNAVVIGDTVEVGRVVRFQVRDANTAHEELAAVLGRFRADSGAPAAALLFSCNGRGSHMFATSDHDARMVGEDLGAGSVAGFFAAGEIGPVAGRNHVHGFTASILSFGGDDGGRGDGDGRRDADTSGDD